jgi:xanthosine utilization system XapX-like protein
LAGFGRRADLSVDFATVIELVGLLHLWLSHQLVFASLIVVVGQAATVQVFKGQLVSFFGGVRTQFRMIASGTARQDSDEKQHGKGKKTVHERLHSARFWNEPRLRPGPFEQKSVVLIVGIGYVDTVCLRHLPYRHGAEDA